MTVSDSQSVPAGKDDVSPSSGEQSPSAVLSSHATPPVPPAVAPLPAEPGEPVLAVAQPRLAVLAGLLALNREFTDVPRLVEALRRWLPERKQDLMRSLQYQGLLSAEQVQQLERDLADHMARHQHDLRQALAGLTVSAQARTALSTLDDPDVRSALALAGPPAHPPGGEPRTQPGETLLTTDPEAPPVALPASPAERFRVLRPHARGGIGQVSVALDEELRREVALKEIQPRFVGEARHRSRFEREAEITGRLEHPGIVPVYGMGHHPDGQPYYAMRLIKGQSLKEAIRRFHSDRAQRPAEESQLMLRQLLNRFVTVCNTMAYAHSRGVIHRDLKPDNIMLGPYGETLVVDWGLAKVFGPGETDTILAPSDSDEAPGLTEDGAIVGTLAYMSPEQASGQQARLGPATDIYSLGATLHHLLTGQPPFTHADRNVMLECVRSGLHRPPRESDRRIPWALDAIARKAMALDPVQRYRTARELADDIDRWLAGEPIRACPEPVGRKVARLGRRHRAATLSAAVGVLVLAVVVAGMLVTGSRREERQAQINNLKDRLAVLRQARLWTPDLLDKQDQAIQGLGRLDSDEAGRALDLLRQGIEDDRKAPRQDEAAQQRILAGLSLLERRRPDEARRLREELERWQPLFELAGPFHRLGDVFLLDQVQIQEQALTTFPRAPEPTPLVRTLVSSAGSVQLEARFDRTWLEVPVVGLALNVFEDRSYRFLVAVPEYRPGRHDDDLFQLASLGSTLKTGQRVRVLLLRNNVILRQLVTALPEGPLRLRASRAGERLSFEVNQLGPIAFDDPFPLPPAEAGVLGVYWPQGVNLRYFKGSYQALPREPSPLGPGDQLVARGAFSRALEFYQEQGREAGAGARKQQARYKEAMALLELRGWGEAEPLLRALLDELPADGTAASARWPLLAACQLWLLELRAERFPEADRIRGRLAALADRPDSGQLWSVIPAEVREPILDTYRLRGARWRSAFEAREALDRAHKAVAVAQLIDESPFERRLARWRLADCYRCMGDRASAAAELKHLFSDQEAAPDEQIAYLRDWVWVLIEQKRPEEALTEVNRRLEKPARGPEVLLRIERARLHAVLGQWDAAAREIDDFFRKVERAQVDYADWADASLLRGMVRLEGKGDSADRERQAQVGWREGLMSGGLPKLPRGRLLSGIASNNRQGAITFSAALSTLTGELTESWADFLFMNAISGTGATSKIPVLLSKRSFPASFARDVILSIARDRRGRDLYRRVALRQVGLADFFLEPVKHHLAHGIRLGAYPGGMPPELDGPLWQGAQDLIDSFNQGKIDDQVATDILAIWRGKDDPTRLWARSAPALEPDLRVPAAFALGRRMLVEGHPQYAAPFFREVLAAKRDDVLYRLAGEELKKISQ
jgi:tetratricopeptide (TPR) repeat protein